MAWLACSMAPMASPAWLSLKPITLSVAPGITRNSRMKLARGACLQRAGATPSGMASSAAPKRLTCALTIAQPKQARSTTARPRQAKA